MVTIVEDFKDRGGNWVKSFKRRNRGVESVIGRTYSYLVWNGIRQRCLEGSHQQKENPTYVGCYESSDFKDFQKFTDWHVEQIGYGLPKYQIDKDILFPGNKYYSAETCVLVPACLNTFFTHNQRKSSDLPVGVYKEGDKYRSGISTGCEYRHLGTHNTPEDAYAAYRAAKESQARMWYKRLIDGEYLVDDRVIERLRVWTLEG